jgi:hypothetical protein
MMKHSTSSPTYVVYLKRLRSLEARRKIQYAIIKQLTELHKNTIKVLSRRIKINKRQLRRVQERELKVRYIKKAAEVFTNTRLSYTNKSEVAQQGRNLIYKFALERRINGAIIAGVMKCGKQVPSVQRDRFTKSFITHPENKQKWYDFNRFIQNFMQDKNLESL